MSQDGIVLGSPNRHARAHPIRSITAHYSQRLPRLGHGIREAEKRSAAGVGNALALDMPAFAHSHFTVCERGRRVFQKNNQLAV